MNNDLYQTKYGAWAGRPQGAAPDYNRCCAEVSQRNGSWTSYAQCSNKRGHGPDEAYCKKHDPAVVAARQKASTEAHNIKFNKERYKWHGKTFYDALKLIAEGHNDARGLAAEIIAKFHEGEYK